MESNIGLIFQSARLHFGNYDYLDNLEHDGHNWENARQTLEQRLIGFGWGLHQAGALSLEKMCEFEQWLAQNL